MSKSYVETTSRLGWLMQAVEEALACPNTKTIVDRSLVRRLNTKRLPSDEEMKAICEALTDIGVLRREGNAYRLQREMLIEKREYCRGVRDAAQIRSAPNAESVKLCATIPVSLDSMVEKALRKHTSDLRATIVDLMASAKERIVLASPFWDVQTAREFAEPLAKRLELGVAVDILGRFDSEVSDAKSFLQAALGSYDRCQLFAWYEPTQSGKGKPQTFHFKAAVADGGARAYLGTANLTASSLRSVMELGVVLTDHAARQLHDILNVILSIASPVTRL